MTKFYNHHLNYFHLKELEDTILRVAFNNKFLILIVFGKYS